MRSWDLSDCGKGIWEWDCGMGKHWELEYGVGSAFSRNEVMHGVVKGIAGNCPELGSSVDSSGKQESREAKHVVSNCYVG